MSSAHIISSHLTCYASVSHRRQNEHIGLDDLKAALTTEHLGYSERTISKRQKNQYHKQVHILEFNVYGIQCPL